MARHIEQPGSLHSKPASVKISFKPSSSAWLLTRPDPGTTIALIPCLIFFPLITFAADLKSSILELVHDPINTVLISTSDIF